MFLLNYVQPDRVAILTRVPIASLDFVKSVFAESKVRIIYRGPRAHRKNRSRHTRQSSCLKADATHFSVYYVG
jgi:hypothetical protein